MKAPYYNITANCHLHGEFTVQRKQVRKLSTSGQIYTIKNVVCTCGSWGDVVKIDEVTI